jgi:hypothetical protein
MGSWESNLCGRNEHHRWQCSAISCLSSLRSRFRSTVVRNYAARRIAKVSHGGINLRFGNPILIQDVDRLLTCLHYIFIHPGIPRSNFGETSQSPHACSSSGAGGIGDEMEFFLESGDGLSTAIPCSDFFELGCSGTLAGAPMLRVCG